MQFENILIHDVETSIDEIVDWENYRIGYFNSKNKGKSSKNEDTLFVRSHKGLLVAGVCDGAGGHPRGRDASFAASSTIIDEKIGDNDFRPLDIIQKINDNILNLKSGSAATLAFVTIKDDDLQCFSVGDAEIILWNAHGREIYSNVPHSNIGYQIEAGIMNQEDSLEEDDRYQVNNMLGDQHIRIESTNKISMKKNQTLIVGSDGVFDNISHVELGELIHGSSFDDSFKSIVNRCLDTESEKWIKDDDIAFLLISKIQA